jgi:hypothetical protein
MWMLAVMLLATLFGFLFLKHSIDRDIDKTTVEHNAFTMFLHMVYYTLLFAVFQILMFVLFLSLYFINKLLFFDKFNIDMGAIFDVLKMIVNQPRFLVTIVFCTVANLVISLITCLCFVRARNTSEPNYIDYVKMNVNGLLVLYIVASLIVYTPRNTDISQNEYKQISQVKTNAH